MNGALNCYCAHCWRPFVRMILFTSLCGACEDEGHAGEAETCAMCTNNALDGTQRRLNVQSTSFDPLSTGELI